MKELIEKLENARAPVIVLDAMIYCELHDNCVRDGGAVIQSNPGAKPIRFAPPAYTSSIDKALMLLGDGSEYNLTNLYGVARAEVDLHSVNGPFYGSSISVPIAICIAALRSHEASDE